jgi:hypothetical protein
MSNELVVQQAIVNPDVIRNRCLDLISAVRDFVDQDESLNCHAIVLDRAMMMIRQIEVADHQSRIDAGFNNPNERLLQEAIAFCESVAMGLIANKLTQFAGVLHEAVRQLCEIEVK